VRIVVATIVTLGLCAAMAARPASAQATSTGAATVEPDFSGFWNRVGDLWLDPILDDDGGKPVSRIKVDRPGAEDIWAGDSDNPILQPWSARSSGKTPNPKSAGSMSIPRTIRAGPRACRKS
jgi:hypothetical protein